MRSLFKILIVLLWLIATAAWPPVSSVAAFKYLQSGMPAPAIKGKDMLTGQTVRSDESVGGERQTTCIAFWATWSPRSLELLEDLKTLSERLSGEPFRVIAVNVDSQVTTPGVEDRVRRILDELAPPYPVLLDDKLERFYEYGVVAVPSVALVDAEGIIRSAPSGYAYSVRSGLVESVEILLGLREPEAEPEVIVERYRPKPRAARYYNLAVQLANQRSYESALKQVDKAAEIDSMFSAPFNLRGHIRLERDEPEAALADFRRAVELDSASVSAQAGLGRALLANGDTAEARVVLERTLEMDNAYTVALQDMARCLVSTQEFERAVGILTEAIALNPRDPMLYYDLGRVFRAWDRPRDALSAYRTALELVYQKL